MKEKLSKLAAEEKKNRMNRLKKIKVDEESGLAYSGEVAQDFSCMLNQTNIGANNNKFYLLQIIDIHTEFYLWTRWGRVVSIKFVLH